MSFAGISVCPARSSAERVTRGSPKNERATKLQRGCGNKRRGRPRVGDSRKREPRDRRGASSEAHISEMLKAAAWRAGYGIGHRDPHFNGGDAEGGGCGIGHEREGRVALGLRCPEVRERFMPAVVLPEDEDRATRALDDEHVIRLRKQCGVRTAAKGTLPARGPENAECGRARIRDEELIHLPLMRERRHRGECEGLARARRTMRRTRTERAVPSVSARKRSRDAARPRAEGRR